MEQRHDAERAGGWRDLDDRHDGASANYQPGDYSPPTPLGSSEDQPRRWRADLRALPQRDDWYPQRGGRSRSRGGFAGRGPTSYRRPDEFVRDDVCERLYDNDDVDATDVEVRVDSGVVILTGKVRDRRQKRIAEEVVDEVFGVVDVDNQLRVDGSPVRAPNAAGLRAAESAENTAPGWSGPYAPADQHGAAGHLSGQIQGGASISTTGSGDEQADEVGAYYDSYGS